CRRQFSPSIVGTVVTAGLQGTRTTHLKGRLGQILYLTQTRSPLILEIEINRSFRANPFPAIASNNVAVPMLPSATGAIRMLSSSIKPAARNDPLILPPPSSSSRRIPNAFRSFVRTLLRSMLSLPPNTYDTPLDSRKAR